MYPSERSVRSCSGVSSTAPDWREVLPKSHVGLELFLEEGGVLLHQVRPFLV